MRIVGGDVAEKGPLAVLADPLHGLVEEDIRPVTAVRFLPAVAQQHRIVVMVLGIALGREGDIEAPLFRAVTAPGPEMPFAENPRRVTGFFQHLGQGDGRGGHVVFRFPRPGDAAAELVVSSHELGAGGSAGRRDVIIGETQTFAVEAVEVGRFEDGIAGGFDLTPASVVAEDEDDVRRR